MFSIGFQFRNGRSKAAWFRASAILCAWPAIFVLASQTASAIQAYHFGLDFIETSVMAPPAFFNDFDPFPMTTPTNFFVTQGGFAGWTEQQAQREVALATEAAIRDLDVGDPNQTVRIAIYLGQAPTQLSGQRFNMVLGQSANSASTILGESRQGAFDSPLVADTIVAATYIDSIDDLGSTFLTYDTAEGVINSIAGVAAHEIGHIFDAVHVNTSAAEPDPFPLMATESTGLPTQARLRERRFSTSKPVGLSNAALIIQNAGSVPLGDANLDTSVDALDAAALIANWGLTDRLYHEGNVTSDHEKNVIDNYIIDAADAAIMISNWTADPGPVAALNASAVRATAEYNAVTGEIIVSVNGVNNWYVESATASLTASVLQPPTDGLASGLITGNHLRVGETNLTGDIHFTARSLGQAAPPDLLPGDLQIYYNAGIGQPLELGVVTRIPEPASLALAFLGLYATLSVWRGGCRKSC